MAVTRKKAVKQDATAAATPATTKSGKKLTPNEVLRKSLVKQFGEHIIIKPAEYAKGSISTGSWALDMALGDGKGLPRGRVAEVFGLEQTGKTTLCLHTITNAQHMGMEVVLVDLEKFDPVYATTIGVDVESLIILRPNESSQILDTVISSVRNGAGLVVIDSVASMAPKKEKEQSIDSDTVGIVAKQINKALRNLLDDTFERSATVLFINQLRSDIGLFKSGYVTTGGLGLRAFGSTRLAMKRADPIKLKSDDVWDPLMEQNITITQKKKTYASNWAHVPDIGHGVKVEVVKNKLSAPRKHVELDVIFGQGIDREADLMDVALKLGILQQSSSWLSYPGLEVIDGNGKKGAAKAQDVYELVDMMIQKQAWPQFEQEVTAAWEKFGTPQSS